MKLSAKPFADLVYHVLAHVPGDAPASAWNPQYVAWCAERIGSANDRSLGEDARALASLAPNHDALVRAQLVAWLFETVPDASVFEQSLAELGQGRDPAAELVWCAAALEAEAHARLPDPAIDPAIVSSTLALADVAPNIVDFDLGFVRPLGLRGRVRDREIWIGDAPVSHLAWQCAHEAAAVELSDAHPELPFASVEHGSVVLLAVRSERAGRADAHARWLASLRAPSPDPDSLDPALRASVMDLVSGPRRGAR